MNNIDSIDEERQMRKDVRRLILEKQLMLKVMTENTFHFSISSIEARNHVANQQVSAFSINVPAHPKGHIKSARLRINGIHLTTITTDAVNAALKTINQIQPYISIVKNGNYASRLLLHPAHFDTKQLAGMTTSFPLVNSPNTGVASGNKTRYALINTDMWFSCDNPFGKEIRFELYDTLGNLLNLGSHANNTCIFNFEVQLLPDFNENDRINF